MSERIKVKVWADEFDLFSIAKPGNPVNATYAAYGLRYVGIVEIEPCGVVWGTPDEVERIVMERVEAEVKAGRVQGRA